MYNYGGWNRQQQQQQQQLPAGWEPKWDPNNRRWFYIDHNTKTTHWELPQQRSPFPQQQNTARFSASTAQPAIVPKQNFVNSLKNQFPSAGEEVIKEVLVNTNNNFMGAKVALESLGYSRKVEVTPNPKFVKQLVSEHISVSSVFAESLLKKHNNDLDAVRKVLADKRKKTSAVEPLPRHVKTLKEEFPSAADDVIKQVLSSCSNVIASARSSLVAMGYKKQKKQAQGSSSSSQPSSSKPKELSDKEKKSRLEELKKKFPSISERIIEISLSGTNYDVKMATSVLQVSMDSVKAKLSGTGSSGATGSGSSSSPTRDATPKPASLSPVIFGADDDKEASKEYAPKIFTKPSDTVPKQTVYRQPEYRSVTRKFAPPEKKVYVKKVPRGYESPNRCTPMGPNSDLVNGPDPSLMQKNLLKPSGPNPENRSGPLMSNRCGPDPSNYQGSAGLHVGPMKAGQTPILV